MADTFDAMPTDRPYQRRMPTGKAVERIVMLSGRRFDPRVVQAYEQGALQVIEVPSGSVGVRLPGRYVRDGSINPTRTAGLDGTWMRM